MRSRIHVHPEDDRFRGECQECGWRSPWVSRRTKAERLLAQHQAAAHDAADPDDAGPDAASAGGDPPADPEPDE